MRRRGKDLLKVLLMIILRTQEDVRRTQDLWHPAEQKIGTKSTTRVHVLINLLQNLRFAQIQQSRKKIVIRLQLRMVMTNNPQNQKEEAHVVGLPKTMRQMAKMKMNLVMVLSIP